MYNYATNLILDIDLEANPDYMASDVIAELL